MLSWNPVSDAGAALYRRRTSARLPPLPPTTSPPLFRGAQRRPRNTPPPSGTIRGKHGVFSTISRQKNAGLASQHPRDFSVIWRPPRAVRDADFPGAAPAPAGAWSIKGRSRWLFCGPRRRPKSRGGSRTARVGSVHLRRMRVPLAAARGGPPTHPTLRSRRRLPLTPQSRVGSLNGPPRGLPEGRWARRGPRTGSGSGSAARRSAPMSPPALPVVAGPRGAGT